jgi:hypothetical protein
MKRKQVNAILSDYDGTLFGHRIDLLLLHSSG